MVTINAPSIDNTGSSKKDEIFNKLKKKDENMIANMAPTAAPLDTPINPGSTSGFLNKPCKTAPADPSANPTIIPKSNLGSLIFQSTDSCILLNDKSSLDDEIFNLDIMISNIFLILKSTGPYISDVNETIIKTNNNT